MTADGSAEWRRRAELTSLLRACRSRVIRAAADGHGGGMRQEDVADLAGLSVRAYAGYERGEARNPRPDKVDAIAAALRMTEAERGCLHVLATGRQPPPPPGDGARPAAGPVFLELLARQDPNPAIITDASWTVIAWNDAMTAWAGGWPGEAPDGFPNLALYLFSDRGEERLADIRAARRAIVAGLRYQYARNVASDRFAALVDRLRETGPEARELWDRHEIAIPPREYRLRLRHPGHGVIEAPGAALRISASLWMHVAVLPGDIAPPGRLPRPAAGHPFRRHAPPPPAASPGRSPAPAAVLSQGTRWRGTVTPAARPAISQE